MVELLILAIFAIYWASVEYLKKKGHLEKAKITAYGPILMVRTFRLNKFIDKLAKFRKFWRIFADIGLVSIFFGMVFMFFMIVLVDYVMLTSPPQPSEFTSLRAALLLPGINPFIPLVWGLIGLIVTLIVHEFSHAILCRVENVKVKSIGLLLALVPIGGFAEPDEDELKAAPRKTKIRVFSSGIVANFLVAFLAFAAFFSILPLVNPTLSMVDDNGKIVGKITEINGFKVSSIEDLKSFDAEKLVLTVNFDGDGRTFEVRNIWGVKILNLIRDGDKIYPAEEAGLKRGDLIIYFDGQRTENFNDFRAAISQKNPGDMVEVTVLRDGEILNFTVQLAELKGRAFIGAVFYTGYSLGGINIYDSNEILKNLNSIPELAKNPVNWFLLVAMPFSFQGFAEEYLKLFEAPDYVFYLLNLFYWIAWINFYVGLFNCLPAVPLDGGRVLDEILRIFIKEKSASRIVSALSAFIFASIILAIAIPNLNL
ncbi:MAG: site-2 protease family protein [Archaeoglobales archaeon]|nr:site-2 protease family protein [Archaeoglobales archaeon]